MMRQAPAAHLLLLHGLADHPGPCRAAAAPAGAGQPQPQLLLLLLHVLLPLLRVAASSPWVP
jgi:hypothetical protein